MQDVCWEAVQVDPPNKAPFFFRIRQEVKGEETKGLPSCHGDSSALFHSVETSCQARQSLDYVVDRLT